VIQESGSFCATKTDKNQVDVMEALFKVLVMKL
jgi:hypothetical protein